jgi:hypothetical protein
VKARFQSAHGQERVDEEEPGEDEDEFVADLEFLANHKPRR